MKWFWWLLLNVPLQGGKMLRPAMHLQAWGKTYYRKSTWCGGAMWDSCSYPEYGQRIQWKPCTSSRSYNSYPVCDWKLLFYIVISWVPSDGRCIEWSVRNNKTDLVFSSLLRSTIKQNHVRFLTISFVFNFFFAVLNFSN